MSTKRQKESARTSIRKAQPAATKQGKASAAKKTTSRKKSGDLSTARRDDLPDSAFAFPKERKEPLIDAKHVRNAISRFDQVEGVTDKERAAAWKRIKTAAKKHSVEVSETDWKDLFEGGKARKVNQKAPSTKARTTSKSANGGKRAQT